MVEILIDSKYTGTVDFILVTGNAKIVEQKLSVMT